MFEIEDIIKSANIYLAAKDKNLKYIYCSEGLARLLDLESPSTIVGKTDYDFHTDKTAQLYQSGDLRVLKSGRSYNVREKHPAHGKTIEIVTTKHPLKDRFSALAGVALSFVALTDITSTVDLNTLENKVEDKFFTKREQDVFDYIIMGLTAKEIAKKLLLSPRTIEDYIDHIKIKLQCRRKHHIVEAAMRLGMLQNHMLAK